jgi:hypothetical protein
LYSIQKNRKHISYNVTMYIAAPGENKNIVKSGTEKSVDQGM